MQSTIYVGMAASARLRGVDPGRARPWRGGGWARWQSHRATAWAAPAPIHVAGLVWGLGAIASMVWPRAPDLPWVLSEAMLLSFAGVLAAGLLYMLALRPYDNGIAPAGDAIL